MDQATDLRDLPENRLAKSFTYLFAAISTIAWGCVAVFMFGPVFHLYARGQGRMSALLGIELVPFAMSITSTFLPLWLRKRNHAVAGLLCPIASCLIWGVYFYVIARLMAI